MQMPVWFHARRVGGVPVHWTPVVWQGWAVVGVFLLALTGTMTLWAATEPGRVVGIALGLVVVLFAVAALTDGDESDGERPTGP